MVSNGLTETQIGKMGLKKKDGPIGKALEWSQLENLSHYHFLCRHCYILKFFWKEEPKQPSLCQLQ